MDAFTRQRRVRFSETDYAGIMFYPRYIEVLNDAVEDWFREVAECSFDSLLDDYGLGSPLVSLETEFFKPNRLGDEIEIAVYVDHVGASSIRFRVEAMNGDEIRVRSLLTHVCVTRDISKATPWPPSVREKFVKGVH